MCNFFSGLAFPDGDIQTYDETDEHEPMIAVLGLNDSGTPIASRAFARWEFTPPADLTTIEDLNTWTLRVDESVVPAWWGERESRIREQIEDRVRRMFVRDERQFLIGGKWILLPGSRLHRLVGGRIVIACTGANLNGANLYGANLSSANLYSAHRLSIDPVPAGWTLTDMGVLVRATEPVTTATPAKPTARKPRKPAKRTRKAKP